MKTENYLPSDSDPRLGEIIAGYLEAVEDGQNPDRAALLAKYSDLAEPLCAFFANHDLMAKVGKPLQSPKIPSPADAATVGLEEITADPSRGRVRYFGDYELLEEIARGGMGVVYKARQVSLNRVIALKMILSGQFASAADVQRFRLEAEAAGRLDHPNIVPIYEVGEHEGQQYFSMKLVEGKNLGDIIAVKNKPTGRDDYRQAAHWLALVARAVHHAHQRGLLHRDLKPGNILLDRELQPHITDFGLAKRTESDSRVTQSGAIIGTPSYMAPEQARAEKQLTVAADVYSLGAILYEMLTGQPPFRAATPLDTILQVLGREPEAPRRLNPVIPADLETICLKCLAKEPARRYSSAEELAQDLERWQRGEPIRARSVGKVEQAWFWCRRNPALAAVSATAVLLLVLSTVGAIAFGLHQAKSALDLKKAADDLEAKEKETSTALGVSEKIRTELVKTDKKRQYFTNRAVLADLKRGLDLWHQGDAALGMLWLARSLEGIQGEDPDLERVICTNLAYAPYFVHPLKAMLPHKEQVWNISYSPDGKRVVTGSWDGTVRLWDAVTGQPIGKPMKHKGRVHQVRFSPDGKRLATCASTKSDKDGEVADYWAFLWDGLSGEPVGEPLKHNEQVGDLAFSPDSKWLVTGEKGPYFTDTKISPKGKIWNAATGQKKAVFGPIEMDLQRVAFSPDGQFVVTVGMGKATLWKVSVEQPAPYWQSREGLVIDEKGSEFTNCWDAVFSPDGKYLAVTGDLQGWTDKRQGDSVPVVRIWNMAELKEPNKSGSELDLFPGSKLWSLAFSPNSKYLATAGRDGIARLWLLKPSTNPNEGKKLVAELQTPEMVHQADVEYLAFSADNKTLMTCSRDATARLWEVASRKPIGVLHQGLVPQGNFHPSGLNMGTGSFDANARLWNLAPGKVASYHLVSFPPSYPYTHLSRFSPDGGMVWTSKSSIESNTFLIWSTMTGKLLKSIITPFDFMSCASFSPDGSKLFTGGRTSSELDLPPDALPKKSPQVTPGGPGQLLPPNKVNEPNIPVVRIWDLQAGNSIGKPWFPIKPQNPVAAIQSTIVDLAISPDGKTTLILVEISGSDKVGASEKKGTFDQKKWVKLELQQWDIGTGKLVGGPWELAKYNNSYFQPGSRVAFCPDGKSVLLFDRTVGSAGIERFDLKTGKKERIKAHWDEDLQFSPDGKLAALKEFLKVHLVQLPEWKKLPLVLTHTSGTQSLAFSPDGKTLVTTTMDRKCYFWDVATGKAKKKELAGKGYIKKLVFTPDGKSLLTLSSDHIVRLWDVETLQPLSPEIVHQGDYIKIDINKTGTHFLVQDGKGTYLYPIPQPVPANAERVLLWAQVLTGVELDAEGRVQVLTLEQWNDRKQRLEKLGGPPGPGN